MAGPREYNYNNDFLLTLFLCFSPGQKQQTRTIYCELYIVYELILAIKRKSALAVHLRFAHFCERFYFSVLRSTMLQIATKCT